MGELQDLMVLLLLSLLALQTSAETTAAISPDGTIQAILDAATSSTFECVVREAGALTWIVDGIPAQDERIRVDRGITMTGVNTMDNSVLQENITVPNSAVNNQTALYCVAKNIRLPEVNSNEVVLELLTQDSLVTDFTTTQSPETTRPTSISVSSEVVLSSTIIIFMITLSVSLILILL